MPATPPAAPAAAPAPRNPPNAPSGVAPSGNGVIQVAPPPARTIEDIKPDSAKGKLFSELEKKAKPTNSPRSAEQPKTPEAKAPESREAVKPVEPPANPNPKPEEAAAPKPEDGKVPEAATPNPKDGKGKVNPWRLVDDYKKQVAAKDEEIKSLKTSQLPENDRKALEERVTKAEGRNKELEDYLRYVDYSKTEDFQAKHVAPYEKAWHRAMNELKELRITDPETQQVRAISAQDMLELVNMPLQRAREVAESLFGNFANDVMVHRKEIRGLYEARETALEDARKNGGAALEAAQKKLQEQQSQMRDGVVSDWNKENERILADPKYNAYFKPREGDGDWNNRLAKGFELVDKAFAENPMSPGLTPEQRQQALKRHAAVRFRAASWGALRGEVERLSAELKKVNEKLSQFESSEPGTHGKTPAAASAPVNSKAALMGELEKIARR